MIVDARKSSILKSTVDTLLLCLLDVTVQRDQDAKLGLSWLRCAGWNFKVIHLHMSLVMIVMSLWPLVDAVYVFAVCFSCVFFFWMFHQWLFQSWVAKDHLNPGEQMRQALGASLAATRTPWTGCPCGVHKVLISMFFAVFVSKDDYMFYDVVTCLYMFVYNMCYYQFSRILGVMGMGWWMARFP